MEEAVQEALVAVDLARSARLHVSELTCASADSCRVCNNNNSHAIQAMVDKDEHKVARLKVRCPKISAIELSTFLAHAYAIPHLTSDTQLRATIPPLEFTNLHWARVI